MGLCPLAHTARNRWAAPQRLPGLPPLFGQFNESIVSPRWAASASRCDCDAVCHSSDRLRSRHVGRNSVCGAGGCRPRDCARRECSRCCRGTAALPPRCEEFAPLEPRGLVSLPSMSTRWPSALRRWPPVSIVPNTWQVPASITTARGPGRSGVESRPMVSVVGNAGSVGARGGPAACASA